MSHTEPVSPDGRPADEPSIAVLEAIAAASDRSVRDLPPLTEAIDPDALDALVASMTAGEIRFEYWEFIVSVAADGTVELEPMA